MILLNCNITRSWWMRDCLWSFAGSCVLICGGRKRGFNQDLTEIILHVEIFYKLQLFSTNVLELTTFWSLLSVEMSRRAPPPPVSQRLKQFSLKISICSLAFNLRVLMLESLWSGPGIIPPRNGRPGLHPLAKDAPSRLEATGLGWFSRPDKINYLIIN